MANDDIRITCYELDEGTLASPSEPHDSQDMRGCHVMQAQNEGYQCPNDKQMNNVGDTTAEGELPFKCPRLKEKQGSSSKTERSAVCFKKVDEAETSKIHSLEAAHRNSSRAPSGDIW